MSESRVARAVELMTRFADYSGQGRFDELALQLVEQVHRVLGRHRDDDTRAGWISGLGPAEGAAHPTRGGVRIGKPLPERAAGARLDERLEWDRDGQYFHYLTKWMHALDQTTRATGQPLFNTWARELAAAAHRAFVYTAPGGGRRMYWKMSIDLSRPQVPSMGQHDPLDGVVTCSQLDATAAALPGAPAAPSLAAAAADFAAMLDPQHLATGDPLGLGGLLADAWRTGQLVRQGAWPGGDDLVDALLAAALVGIRHYVTQPDLRAPADRRLAFRELGLAIGLAAVRTMAEAARGSGAAGTRARLDQLSRFAPLGAEIEAFWLVPAHRETPTWVDHQGINDVMLATCLVPEGFLVLPPLRAGR